MVFLAALFAHSGFQVASFFSFSGRQLNSKAQPDPFLFAGLLKFSFLADSGDVPFRRDSLSA